MPASDLSKHFSCRPCAALYSERSDRSFCGARGRTLQVRSVHRTTSFVARYAAEHVRKEGEQSRKGLASIQASGIFKVTAALEPLLLRTNNTRDWPAVDGEAWAVYERTRQVNWVRISEREFRSLGGTATAGAIGR